ncbi:MAG TPA: GNAT family N-acetyltransferase [Solirubrobacteraceae bacterium]|nr:GNAT family N-acetyltransferase [Solirubrobacteraceae bacterium]
MSARVRIRPARPADVELIFSLIVGLAEYERAPDQVTGTPQLLAQALFGPRPSAEALVAEVDGEDVGFALFHGSFSTWECRPGIWLEDLYVPPEHRRAGVGRALLAQVAAIAVERGCARLEWAALDWNTPALEFYRGLGATRLEEWLMHRLDGPALRAIAAQSNAGHLTRPADA